MSKAYELALFKKGFVVYHSNDTVELSLAVAIKDKAENAPMLNYKAITDLIAEIEDSTDDKLVRRVKRYQALIEEGYAYILNTKTKVAYMEKGVVDKQKNVISVNDISAGAVINLVVQPKDYDYRGKKGVTAYIAGIQLLEAGSYGGNAIEMFDEEGDTETPADGVGNVLDALDV